MYRLALPHLTRRKPVSRIWAYLPSVATVDDFNPFISSFSQPNGRLTSIVEPTSLLYLLPCASRFRIQLLLSSTNSTHPALVVDPVGFTEPALLLFLSTDFPGESPWDSHGVSGTAHLMADNHLRATSTILELDGLLP